MTGIIRPAIGGFCFAGDSFGLDSTADRLLPDAFPAGKADNGSVAASDTKHRGNQYYLNISNYPLAFDARC